MTTNHDIKETISHPTGLKSLIIPLGPEASAELIIDPHNRRLKLLGGRAADLSVEALADLFDLWPAGAGEFSKFTLYTRPGDDAAWPKLGFRQEGIIHGFFRDGEDSHLWASYATPERAENSRTQAQDDIIRLAESKPRLVPKLPEGYTCQVAEAALAPEITKLLAATFSEYPSLIKEDILARQIETGANHFRVLRDNATGEIIALASAEVDKRRGCVEMTDCVTRPKRRGQGLMAYLLWRLEADVHQDLGINCLYTLARAEEVGMNCVFGKLGYKYTGRLVNNCRMPQGWESMNIWCKTAAGDKNEGKRSHGLSQAR